MPAVLLVAIDFSSCARPTMRVAAKLAPSLDASLVLVYVTEVPAGLLETSEIRPLPDHEPVEAGRFIREASAAELERYADELRVLGLEVSTRVELGDPVESILRAAAELDPLMIVVGTHGRTGLAHLLIGSVAEKIMRRAGRPVLTVPLASAGAASG